MKILSADTSGAVASVAVLDEENLLGQYSINHKKTHSQKLMPMMDQLLKNLELKPDDIDIYSAAIGPGSFTGLRIGIATIKGIAQALNKPVIGVPTLEGLAFNVCGSSRMICPIIDARNDFVYSALYSFEENSSNLKVHVDCQAFHINHLLDIIDEKQSTIFLGDAVYKFESIIRQKLGNKASFAASHMLLQSAGSVGLAAYRRYLSGQTQSYINILPMYIRAPQAERMFKEKCNH